MFMSREQLFPIKYPLFYRSKFKTNASPRITAPLALCYEGVPRKQTCIVVVVFNHKYMIIDSFKDWTLTVARDGSEDPLIHCLKPNHPCTAGQDWLKELHYIVLQERWECPVHIL